MKVVELKQEADKDLEEQLSKVKASFDDIKTEEMVAFVCFTMTKEGVLSSHVLGMPADKLALCSLIVNSMAVQNLSFEVRR